MNQRRGVATVRRALRLAGMRPLPPVPMRSPIDLRGKRILLTGASSGIGEVAAEKLSACSATVIAVARREHLLTDVVARITERGGTAVAMPANLADLDAIDQLVSDVGPTARSPGRVVTAVMTSPSVANGAAGSVTTKYSVIRRAMTVTSRSP